MGLWGKDLDVPSNRPARFTCCLRVIFQRGLALNFRTFHADRRAAHSTFHRLYIIRGTSSVMNDVPPSFLKRVVGRKREMKAGELNTDAKITCRRVTPLYKESTINNLFPPSPPFLSSFFSPSENPAHFSSFSRSLTRNCARAALMQRVFRAYVPRESNAEAYWKISARRNKQRALNYLTCTRVLYSPRSDSTPRINVSRSNYVINNARSASSILSPGECPRSYRAFRSFTTDLVRRLIFKHYTK